jgi:DNA invertase Pin-like site-specific DNA recombinase
MVTRRSSMEAPMSRAFSYIRFSSKKQQKGESFRRPSEFAVEVCKENGWVLDESLTLYDPSVSAFRGNNAKIGALGEFLEAIRTGRVLRGSVLIIDRLRRNKVGEALRLFISIINSGVSIVTRNPAGRTRPTRSTTSRPCSNRSST